MVVAGKHKGRTGGPMTGGTLFLHRSFQVDPRMEREATEAHADNPRLSRRVSFVSDTPRWHCYHETETHTHRKNTNTSDHDWTDHRPFFQSCSKFIPLEQFKQPSHSPSNDGFKDYTLYTMWCTPLMPRG